MIFTDQPHSYHPIIALCDKYDILIKKAKEDEQENVLTTADILNKILDIPEQFASRFNLQFKQFTKYLGAHIYAILSEEQYELTIKSDNTFDHIFEYDHNPLHDKRIKSNKGKWHLIKFHDNISYPYIIAASDPVESDRSQRMRKLILAHLELLPNFGDNINFEEFYDKFNDLDHKLIVVNKVFKDKKRKLTPEEFDNYVSTLPDLDIPDVAFVSKIENNDPETFRLQQMHKENLERIQAKLKEYNKKDNVKKAIKAKSVAENAATEEKPIANRRAIEAEEATAEDTLQALYSIFTIVDPYFGALLSKMKPDFKKQKRLLNKISSISFQKELETGFPGKRTIKGDDAEKMKKIFNHVKDYTGYDTNVAAKEILGFIAEENEDFSVENYNEFMERFGAKNDSKARNDILAMMRMIKQLKDEVDKKGIGEIKKIFNRVQSERDIYGENILEDEDNSFFKTTKMTLPDIAYYDVERLADEDKYKNNPYALAKIIAQRLRPPSASRSDTKTPIDHEGVHPFMGQIDFTTFQHIRKHFPNDASTPPDINYAEYFTNQKAIDAFKAANSLGASDRYERQRIIIEKEINSLGSEAEIEEADYLDDLYGKIYLGEPIDYDKTDVELAKKLRQAEAEGEDEAAVKKAQLAIVVNEISKLVSSKKAYKLLELQEIIKPDSIFFWTNKLYTYINKAQKVMRLKFALDNQIVLNPLRVQRMSSNEATAKVGEQTAPEYTNGAFFLTNAQYKNILRQAQKTSMLIKTGGIVSPDKLISYFAFRAIVSNFVYLTEIDEELELLPEELLAETGIEKKVEQMFSSRNKTKLNNSFIQSEDKTGYIISPALYDSIFALLNIDKDYDSTFNGAVSSILNNENDSFWGIYSELIENYKDLYNSLENSGYVFNMQKNDPMVQEIMEETDSGKSKMVDPIYMTRPGGGEGIVRKPYESVTGFPTRDRAIPQIIAYAMNENGTYIIGEDGQKIPGNKYEIYNKDLLMSYLSYNNDVMLDIKDAAVNNQSFGEVIDPEMIKYIVSKLAYAEEKLKLNVSHKKVNALEFENLSGGVSIEEFKQGLEGNPYLRRSTQKKINALNIKLKNIKQNIFVTYINKLLDKNTAKNYKNLNNDEFVAALYQLIEEGLISQIYPKEFFNSFHNKVVEFEKILDKIDEIESTVESVDSSAVLNNIRTTFSVKVSEKIHNYFLMNSIIYKSAISGSLPMGEYAKDKILSFINDYIRDNIEIFDKSIDEISTPESKKAKKKGWQTSPQIYVDAFKNNYPKFQESSQEFITVLKRRELKAEDEKRVILMYLFNLIDDADDPMSFDDDFVKTMIINGSTETYEVDEIIQERAIESFKKLGAIETYKAKDSQGVEREWSSGKIKQPVNIEDAVNELTDNLNEDLIYSAQNDNGRYSYRLKSMPYFKSLLLSSKAFEAEKFIYQRVNFYLEDVKRLDTPQEMMRDEIKDVFSDETKEKQLRGKFEAEDVAMFTYEMLSGALAKVDDLKRNDAIGKIKRIERERTLGRHLPGNLEKVVSTIVGTVYDLDKQLFDTFEKVTNAQKISDKDYKVFEEFEEVTDENGNKTGVRTKRFPVEKVQSAIADELENARKSNQTTKEVQYVERILQNIRGGEVNLDSYIKARVGEIAEIAKQNDFDGVHRFTATRTVFDLIKKVLPKEPFVAAGFSDGNIDSVIITNINNELYKDNFSRKKGVYPISNKEFLKSYEEKIKEIDELFVPQVQQHIQRAVKLFHDYENKIVNLAHSINTKATKAGKSFTDFGEVIPGKKEEFKDQIIGAEDENPNISNIYKLIKPVVNYLIRDLIKELKNAPAPTVARINRQIENRTEIVANYAYKFLDYLLDNMETYPTRAAYKFNTEYKLRTEEILRYVNLLYGKDEQAGAATLTQDGFTQNKLHKMIENAISTSSSRGLNEEALQVLNVRSDIEKEKNLDEVQSLPLNFDSSTRIGMDENGEPTVKIPNAFGNGDEFIVIQRMPLSRAIIQFIAFINENNLKSTKDIKNYSGNSDEIKNKILNNFNEKGIQRLFQLANISKQVGLSANNQKNYYVKLRLVESEKVDYEKGQIPSIKDNNNIGETVAKMGGKDSKLKRMMDAIMIYDKSKTDEVSFSSMFSRRENSRDYHARDTILSEENLNKLATICQQIVEQDVFDLDATFIDEMVSINQIIQDKVKEQKDVSEEGEKVETLEEKGTKIIEKKKEEKKEKAKQKEEEEAKKQETKKVPVNENLFVDQKKSQRGGVPGRDIPPPLAGEEIQEGSTNIGIVSAIGEADLGQLSSEWEEVMPEMTPEEQAEAEEEARQDAEQYQTEQGTSVSSEQEEDAEEPAQQSAYLKALNAQKNKGKKSKKGKKNKK